MSDTFTSLMSRAEAAYEFDFFSAAPPWAKEAVLQALTDDGTIRWTDGHLKHLSAALACVGSVDRRCSTEIAKFGPAGATQTVKRRKRTRSQIRAAGPKPKEQKKKGR